MTLSASPAHARALARVRLGTTALLTLVVAASAVVRTLAAWLRATPTYFPDEYIYAELGRSLAEGGRPAVDGAAASFPALLQPILTAPAWLAGDVETSYRLIQAGGAVAMSLAAIPVFLLARALRLSRAWAVALAVLAVAIPDLAYASSVLSEPIAYPLALGAIAAGVVVLARPSRGLQLGFLALVALAVFARAQFAALPLCFLVATLVVGMRERRIRAALREQLLPLGVFAATAVALGAVGIAQVLGYYRGIGEFGLDLGELARYAGLDALVLAYASGWVLVPGAALGLGLAVARPRTRIENAFGALASTATVALLVEAALVAANGSPRALERYVFYAAPLIGIAFALYATRGWPYRLVHALGASVLVALSAAVPLSGYAAADGKIDSPFLSAVFQVERAVGDVALGALAVALAAALLAVAAVLASLRPRRAGPLVLGLALAASAASSLGVTAYTREHTASVRADLLAARPSWVDERVAGTSTLLTTPGSLQASSLETLFWNRSLGRVLTFPQGERVHAFHGPPVEVGPDGSLTAAGRPVRGPLLVDEYATTVELRDAERVARASSYTLWRPRGDARLALAMIGRHGDGWLAPRGELAAWPERAGGLVTGRIVFEVAPLPARERMTLELGRDGGEAARLALVPGWWTTVRVAVCSRGPWRARFRTSSFVYREARAVSARVGAVRFEPDPQACSEPPAAAGPAVPAAAVTLSSPPPVLPIETA